MGEVKEDEGGRRERRVSFIIEEEAGWEAGSRELTRPPSRNDCTIWRPHLPVASYFILFSLIFLRFNEIPRFNFELEASSKLNPKFETFSVWKKKQQTNAKTFNPRRSKVSQATIFVPPVNNSYCLKNCEAMLFRLENVGMDEGSGWQTGECPVLIPEGVIGRPTTEDRQKRTSFFNPIYMAAERKENIFHPPRATRINHQL